MGTVQAGRRTATLTRTPLAGSSSTLARSQWTPKTTELSYCAARFTNGANLYPRLLFRVEEAPSTALGVPAGRLNVQSKRSATEKAPWKHVAGVSVSYYTRLEQGISRGASPEVLGAIGRALHLDTHEREHLERLAGAARRAPQARRPRPERVSDETRDLIRALDGVPALVLGRRTDVLAWNHLGHALLAGHLDPASVNDVSNRPNMSRMMFLDKHNRELYRDWRRKARAVVGYLRIAVGWHPDDRDLAALIGELTMKSPEFVTMRGDHRIAPCDAASYDRHHPVVGAVTVTQQTLGIARSPGHKLVRSDDLGARRNLFTLAVK